MVTHQQHGEGICDCPKLRAVGWIGPAPTGWQEPILLVVSREPETVHKLRQIVRWAGLRPDLVLYADRTLLHFEGQQVATLAFGTQQLGPLPVRQPWIRLAHEHGEIVLMLGTMAVPEDMDPDVYLDRHADEVVTGIVPVAGAGDSSRRCPVPSPDALVLAGQARR